MIQPGALSAGRGAASSSKRKVSSSPERRGGESPESGSSWAARIPIDPIYMEEKRKKALQTLESDIWRTGFSFPLPSSNWI
jgi:hypothetical protein